MKLRVSGTCLMCGTVMFFSFFVYGCNSLSQSQITQIISKDRNIACKVLEYKIEPEEIKIGYGSAAPSGAYIVNATVSTSGTASEYYSPSPEPSEYEI